MIVLRHARFISGGRIYKSGDAVPENAFTHTLAEMGFAKICGDNVSSKPPAKKSKAESPRENDTGNP